MDCHLCAAQHSVIQDQMNPPGQACTYCGISKSYTHNAALVLYQPISPRQPSPSRSFDIRMSPLRNDSDAACIRRKH